MSAACFISFVCDVTVTKVLGQSARMTPLVKVIQQVDPAIASLFLIRDGNQIVAGSGTILHPAGFVLTNNHVLSGEEGFALLGSSLPNQQKPLRFKVVGRYPERDLAIVKLEGSGPYATVEAGRSDDLMNGETVIVAGNPGGRGLVFTSGIISATAVLAGAPNALVMTNYKIDHRPRFIQFDAASNGGNSDGPLINMDGQVIGIVSEKIYQEQNVGFAIPIDAVYTLISDICEAELRTGFTTGIHLHPQNDIAEVESIDTDSAAAEAGMEPRDQIVSINEHPVNHIIDWQLELLLALQNSKPIALQLKRSERLVAATLRPRKIQPDPAADVTESDLTAGLKYDFYHGQYSLLPDFSALTAVSTGVANSVSLDEIKREQNDYFAVAMSGFLKVDKDGVYRLTITSDDGSKAWLDDKLIIDNDGNHPPAGVAELLYLQKGFHALRIEYFQGNGGAELSLQWQRNGAPVAAVPSSHLWHK